KGAPAWLSVRVVVSKTCFTPEFGRDPPLCRSYEGYLRRKGPAPSRPRSGPTCVPLLGLGPLRHMLVLERGFRLQHLRPEELTVPSSIRAGDHEDAIAAVVKRSRVIRRSRHMRLDHFEDE